MRSEFVYWNFLYSGSIQLRRGFRVRLDAELAGYGSLAGPLQVCIFNGPCFHSSISGCLHHYLHELSDPGSRESRSHPGNNRSILAEPDLPEILAGYLTSPDEFEIKFALLSAFGVGDIFDPLEDIFFHLFPGHFI
jgi:hypothetical protein